MKAQHLQEDMQTDTREQDQETARDLQAEKQVFERILQRQSEASRTYLAGKFRVA
ncbi:hypothetical protein HKCCE4037_04635 [Rhodobacterales bacterium HKCCE4037]|nr:hypothetical protein [Rhodobacterales bacterium HKCCE4037]